jgi:hypothetical protein
MKPPDLPSTQIQSPLSSWKGMALFGLWEVSEHWPGNNLAVMLGFPALLSTEMIQVWIIWFCSLFWFASWCQHKTHVSLFVLIMTIVWSRSSVSKMVEETCESLGVGSISPFLWDLTLFLPFSCCHDLLCGWMLSVCMTLFTISLAETGCGSKRCDIGYKEHMPHPPTHFQDEAD